MVDDADRWLRTLPRLREVEANAATPSQRTAISQASGTLFAAARAKGWTGAELARASGYDAGQVNYRAAQARQRSTGHGSGLDLPVPLRLRPAVASKWIPPQQARQRLGVGQSMLYRWRLHGLLPRSRYRGRRGEYYQDDVEYLVTLRDGGRRRIPYGLLTQAFPELQPQFRGPPPFGSLPHCRVLRPDDSLSKVHL